MAVNIRAATPEDAQAIAEIHVAGWRVAYRGLMPDAVIESISLDQRRGFWKGALSRPGVSKIAVGQAAASLVAFCSYGPTRDDDISAAAEIYALYVEPARWRQGWGRALCEHAERGAAERNHAAMTLWVLKGNQPAQRFYERLGYRADAERTDTKLTGTPLVEVRYRKAIG